MTEASAQFLTDYQKGLKPRPGQSVTIGTTYNSGSTNLPWITATNTVPAICYAASELNLDR